MSLLSVSPSMHMYHSLIRPVFLASLVVLAGCAQAPSSLLDVPFVPQSPYGVWDAAHEEACEEMSLLMVHHYLQNTILLQENAEDEVQELITFETSKGYGVDVSTSELAAIASEFYGYESYVLEDITPGMIRFQIDIGNPVLLPVLGRALENPYFKGTDPFFHMVVVTGYRDGGFVTNEPGTKEGEDYFYPEDVLMNAVHDWTGSRATMHTGPKNALVLERLESF